MPDTGRYIIRLGSLASMPGQRRKYKSRFVRAGRARQADGELSDIELTPLALQSAQAAGKFDQCTVFMDHTAFFEYPSLKDLAGVTLDSAWNDQDQSVEGVVELYSTPAGNIAAQLLDEILVDPATAPDVGLSMVCYPEFEPGSRVITAINHIASIDLVFQPAADGRILQALSSHSIPPKCSAQCDTSNPENPVNLVHPVKFFSQGDPQPMTAQSQDPVGADLRVGPTPEPPTVPAPTTVGADLRVSTSAPPPITQPPQAVLSTAPQLPSVTVVQTILRSGLPAPAQERLASQAFNDLPALQAAIEIERLYLAAIAEPGVVQLGSAPRGGRISSMLDSLDRITLAAEALIAGVRPQGVQPLTGIRELYHLLSGDYEMTGLFQAERIQLANVTSSTMAGIVANALNKAIVSEFQQYPQWWLPITLQMDFATLQQVKWITLGGVGELPTVAEGAAYTELTWDDNTETASFVKKGGYLGITLETIDKDDTGRVATAPRALAQAAWLTLSKSISSIFTSASGAGPNLADGTALFAVGRGNLGTTALSMTTWNAARLAMRKFTELNSGERLGALVAPKYLLVPPDLEITATQILASQSDYTYALSNGTGPGPANVHAEGDTFDERMKMAHSRVIVVDLWTDANDWAAIADPRLYPTIGIGFRYGRQPEIFSVASPTAGLMFSNDTLPVKVRFFYATGPMEWRGMYKANVA